MPGVGTFQLVASDDATVLFDCNTGVQLGSPTNNPGLVETAVRELQLHGPALRPIRHRPTTRAGRTVYIQEDLVQSTWRQVIRQPQQDTDKLIQGWDYFVRLLRSAGPDGARIKYVGTGSSITKFIELEPPDDLPALTGEAPEDPFRLFTARFYPEGILVSTWRQPYLRGVELDPTVNVLVNPMLLVDTNGDGKADGWTYTLNSGAAPTYSISALDEAARVAAGGASTVTLNQVYGTAAPGDVWSAQVAAFTDNAAALTLVIEYQNAGGGSLGSTSSGPISLSGLWQIITVTSGAAPANTAKVNIKVTVAITNAGGATVRVRNAQLEKAGAASLFVVGPQALSNDPATGRMMPLWIQGDAPAQVKLNVQGDSGAAVQAIVAATRGRRSPGGRNLVDLLNRGYVQCESGVGVDPDTTSQADFDPVSGGLCAETTYATNASMARRLRIPITTLLSSLRGGSSIWVRVKPLAASVHRIQLGWGPSQADPVPSFEPEVTLDASAAINFGYTDLEFGRIYIPTKPALAAVTLECWSARDSGSGNLRWDVLALAPFPDTEIPGDQFTQWLTGSNSAQSWLGSQLVKPTNPAGYSPGTVSGTKLILNANNEAGGTPPVGGAAWLTGQNKIVFRLGELGDIPGGSSYTYKILIRNITDSVDVPGTLQTFTVLPGQLGGGFGGTYRTIVFNAVAGKLYEAQVAVTSPPGTGELDVYGIQHTAGPSIGNNEQARSDPTRIAAMIETLDSSGALLFPMPQQGPVPAILNPELALAYFNYLDSPVMGAFYASVLGRTPMVSAIYAPRYES